MEVVGCQRLGSYRLLNVRAMDHVGAPAWTGSKIGPAGAENSVCREAKIHYRRLLNIDGGSRATQPAFGIVVES